MIKKRLPEDEIPYFSWDRSWTTRDIRSSLKSSSGFDWIRLAAWIMREAAFRDVWQFLKPREVWDRISEIEPLLGRKKMFWKYILGAWHELGRI